MVEFAIAAPILLLFLLGLISFALYFHGKALLQKGAEEAITIAAVAPDLEDPENNDAIIATIEQQALVFPLLSMFRDGTDDDPTQYGSTRIKNVELDIGEALAGTITGHLARYPITVTIEAEMINLIPFLPPWQYRITAAGYREAKFHSTLPEAFDCQGNPISFDDPPQTCLCATAQNDPRIYSNPESDECDCYSPFIHDDIDGDGDHDAGECVCPSNRTDDPTDPMNCICLPCSELSDEPNNGIQNPTTCECNCPAEMVELDGECVCGPNYADVDGECACNITQADCTAEIPHFNSSSCVCEECPGNLEYNPETLSCECMAECEGAMNPLTCECCPEGQVFIEAEGICRCPDNICSPNQYPDSANGCACIDCDAGQIYDPTIDECSCPSSEDCPGNAVRDPNNNCECHTCEENQFAYGLQCFCSDSIDDFIDSLIECITPTESLPLGGVFNPETCECSTCEAGQSNFVNCMCTHTNMGCHPTQVLVGEAGENGEEYFYPDGSSYFINPESCACACPAGWEPDTCGVEGNCCRPPDCDDCVYSPEQGDWILPE